MFIARVKAGIVAAVAAVAQVQTLLLALCVLAVAPAAAQAGTIDFESLPAGTYLAGPPQGTDPLRPQGVYFRSPDEANLPPAGSGHDYGPYCGPPTVRAVGSGDTHSGTHLAESPFCGGEIGPTGTFGVFTSLHCCVSVYAGVTGMPPGTPRDVTLAAFDLNGNRVADATTTLPGSDASRATHQLSILRLGNDDIAYFALYTPGSSSYANLVFDDLSFDDPSPTQQPAFAIAPPTAPTVAHFGESVTVPIHIHRFNGSTGGIKFSLAGVPPGVSSYSFVPNPATGDSTTLTIHASPDGPSADSSVQVTGAPTSAGVGSSPNTQHFELKLEPPFSVSAYYPSVRLATCDTNVQNVHVTTYGGFRGAINLSAEVVDPKGSRGMQATIDPSVLLMAGGNSADATLRITAPPDDSVRDADVVIHSSSGSIHGDDDVVHVARYVGQVETISAASGNEPWLNQPGDAVTLTGAGLCNAGVRFGDGGPIAHAIDADANGHRLTVRVPFGALNGDLAVMRNGIAMTTTADTQIASTHQRWPGSFTATSYRHRFGFPFANWGGWHPTIDEAVRLFGEDQVYVQVNPCGPWSFGIINCGGSTPVEKPSTAFFLEGIDSAVSASGGGRCFGVSLDSVRDLLNGSPASYFSGDDFTRSEIDVLHLAQFSQPVEDYRLGGAGKYSSTDDLEHAIGAYTGQGQPVLVNIEDGGRGHTVVAYLTERDNDGNLVIHTYNPNEPFTSSESIHAGDRQDVENRSTIIVTPGGHWSFAGLQQDDKSPWQGDLSTIEALPFADVPLDHPLIGDQNWQAFVPLGSLSITAPNGALARGVRRLPDLDGSSTAAAYALPASGAYKIALTAAQERHPFLITGGPIQARIVAGGASSAGPDVVSLDRRGVSFAASSGHRKLAIELVAPQHDGSQRVAYVSTSGARTLRVALAAGGGVALNGSGGAMTVRGELASVGRSAGAQRTLLPALRLADHGRIILRPTSWRALSQLPLNILTSQGGQLRTGQLRPRDVTRVPFRIAASSQALHDRKATVELRLRLRRGVPASGVRVLWIVMRGRQIIARHVLRLSGGQARPGVDRLVWTTGRLRRGRLTVLVVAFAAGSDRHGLPQTFIVHTTKTLEVR